MSEIADLDYDALVVDRANTQAPHRPRIKPSRPKSSKPRHRASPVTFFCFLYCPRAAGFSANHFLYTPPTASVNLIK